MSTTPDYRKYAILYVDDEEQALKYFRKGLEKDFRVLTATGVAEALAILEKEAGTIGVVITDQRMPGMPGVELLKRLRTQWPSIVRLLTTAYSDIESAIEAVNSGAIYKYITKPADLKELRETLKGSMELFLTNGERETLMKERLDVMQRMIVADRVRSLAMMAGGISHHLRNSMTALTCFLEETAPAKPGEAAAPVSGAGADPQFTQQLWQLAQKEREHLLQIVRRVGQGVAEPSYHIGDDVEGSDLLRRGAEAAATDLGGKAVTIDAAPELPRLQVDAAAVTHLLRILLNYASRLGKPDGKLVLSAAPASVAGAAGIRICVTGEGPDWGENDVSSFFTPFAFPANDPSDLGLDLLSAFSIAYHHGGDLVVHKSAPAGPGFELLLPVNPSQVRRPELQDGLLEKLLTHFDVRGDKTPGGQAA